MKEFKKVRSTVKPEAVVIDEYSVWVSTDTQEVIKKDDDEKEHIFYEYSLSKYDKDEYILLQSKKNSELEQQLTGALLALTEVYEIIVERE